MVESGFDDKPYMLWAWPVILPYMGRVKNNFQLFFDEELQ
jgi:hypothetical protein